YGLAQYGVLFLHMAGFFSSLSGKSLMFTNLYTQVILFIIASIIIIIINNFIANPTQLEHQTQEKKRYPTLLASGDYVSVMLYQIIANLINMFVLDGPQSIPNT